MLKNQDYAWVQSVDQAAGLVRRKAVRKT